jgi:hypothetical protein
MTQCKNDNVLLDCTITSLIFNIYFFEKNGPPTMSKTT